MNSVPIESTLRWSKNRKLRVNNLGQILGNVEIDANIFNTSMVVYNEFTKSITKIEPKIKYKVVAEDINDLGWVVGSYYDGSNYNGILWTPEFGAQILEGFKPIAINNNGIIAGSNNKGKAALWIRGILVDLSDEMRLERDFSNELNGVGEIYDINHSNQIICLGQSRKGACVVFISSSELDSL